MLVQLVTIQLTLKEAITCSPGPQTSLEICASHKHALDTAGAGVLCDVLSLFIPPRRGDYQAGQPDGGPGDGMKLKQGAMVSVPHHVMNLSLSCVGPTGWVLSRGKSQMCLILVSPRPAH